MTTRTALTIDDIAAAYNHESHDDCPGWLGFGYLGGRRNALDTSDPESTVDPERVAVADLAAVEAANDRHWSAERFFEWLNSKNGRWYADSTLGSDDNPITAAASLVR